MANNINKIFKVPVSKTINYNEGRKSIEQTEDYAVKKNINTQEGTIEKVPVNPNDICNKAYVDSHSGTAGGTSDHALLSNLTYASSGHIGFAASASIPTVGVDFDAVGTDNSDDNAINTRYATTVATNTSFRVTPSTVITAGDNISWTGNTLNVVAGSAAAVSHAALTNLSYASAGHTGFAPALGGDDNYVTDTEKGNLHAPGSDDQDISGIATNAGNITNIETKTDFITVTQAVDLDTMESNIATNNAKISFTWDYDYSDLINNPTTISGAQASAITANSAFTATPSTVITAGDNIAWDGNTLDVSISSGDMSAATFYDTTGGQALTTSFTTVNLDTTETNTDTDMFTLASDVVTVATTGLYQISYTVGFVRAASTRGSIDCQLLKNAGVITSSIVSNYWRDASGTASSATKTITVELTAEDTITIQAKESVNGCTLVADSSSLTIIALTGAKGDTGATGATGGITGGTLTGALYAQDHGTATTDEVINVCYGTSATPPTATTTTEGALYIQYTA